MLFSCKISLIHALTSCSSIEEFCILEKEVKQSLSNLVIGWVTAQTFKKLFQLISNLMLLSCKISLIHALKLCSSMVEVGILEEEAQQSLSKLVVGWVTAQTFKKLFVIMLNLLLFSCNCTLIYSDLCCSNQLKFLTICM